MELLCWIDLWLYARAKDLVVLWVRLTRTHSEWLVRVVLVLNILYGAFYVALARSPWAVSLMLVPIVMYALPRLRAGLPVGFPITLLRLGLIGMSTGMGVGEMLGALVLRHADIGRASLDLAGNLAYFALWYLIHVPPLDPPPSPPQAIPVASAA